MKTNGFNARKYILTATLVFAGLAVAAVGCHKGVSASEQNQNAGQDQGPDPAAANMAPVDGSYAPQPQTYQTGGAPIVRQAPGGGDPNAQSYSQAPNPNNYDPNNYDPNSYDPNADQDAGQPVLEADQPPPELPTYDQPEAPDPDYLWTPGYWSWTPAGYYWVPGVWCAAPYQGALWTPGYWGFYNNRYRFHRGFWGLYIGFYGGVNYGYGYFGTGYQGGYWNGPHFYYNRSVTRVNVSRVTYVYNRTVVVNNVTRVSYNGGRGGITVRPRPAEIAAMRQPHIAPMTAQIRVQQDAAQNRSQFYNQNHGRPAIAAAPRPIVADRGIQRPIPIRETRPIGQPAGQPGGQNGQFRPGQAGQGNAQTGQPARPDQGRQDQGRPDQARPDQGRPAQAGQPAVQPGVRPVQPGQEARPQPGQPQPGIRPNQGNPRVAPNQQPNPQPQIQRPAPQPQTPDVPRREVRPDPQVGRPVPQPQAQPRPQPEARPAPQAQQPRPQPEARPAPQARPAAPAARSAPAAKPAPHEEERR